MSINVKSTKQEVYDAYQELLEENKQLVKEIDNLKKERPNLELKSNKALPSEPIKDKPFIISNFKILDIINYLQVIRNGFSGAVSELSGNLTHKVSELSTLQKQITEIEAYINEIYQIGEISEQSINLLLDEYIEKSASFNKDYNAKEELLNYKLKTISDDWEKEKDIYKFQLNERNEELAKLRKREKEEYNYGLLQERSISKDLHEQEMKRLNAVLLALKEENEKEWEAKEKELSVKESEYSEVNLKVSKLEENKIKEIEKAVEFIKKTLNREALLEQSILEKDAEGERRLNEVKITVLQKNIENQEKKIILLNKQLSEVLKEAKELASKAIDGASSAKSFEALREMNFENKNSVK